MKTLCKRFNDINKRDYSFILHRKYTFYLVFYDIEKFIMVSIDLVKGKLNIHYYQACNNSEKYIMWASNKFPVSEYSEICSIAPNKMKFQLQLSQKYS